MLRPRTVGISAAARPGSAPARLQGDVLASGRAARQAPNGSRATRRRRARARSARPARSRPPPAGIAARKCGLPGAATPWAVVLTISPSTTSASCPWARRNVLVTLAKASSSTANRPPSPAERRHDRRDELASTAKPAATMAARTRPLRRGRPAALAVFAAGPRCRPTAGRGPAPRRRRPRARRRSRRCLAFDDQRSRRGSGPLPDIIISGP